MYLYRVRQLQKRSAMRVVDVAYITGFRVSSPRVPLIRWDVVRAGIGYSMSEMIDVLELLIK